MFNGAYAYYADAALDGWLERTMGRRRALEARDALLAANSRWTFRKSARFMDRGDVRARVERWGQFTGADEALTKITRSVLEEPSRAIEEGVVEAESLVKRLTDDFARTVSQLTDWESRLAEAVDEVAFRERDKVMSIVRVCKSVSHLV